jgi:hypothetical protein
MEIDMRIAMRRTYKGKERLDRNKRETWQRKSEKRTETE